MSSKHSSQPLPTLARRALPVVALGGLAGVLVFALDKPSNLAAAGQPVGADANGVVSADGSSDHSVASAPAGDNSGGHKGVASSVPSAPRRTTNSGGPSTQAQTQTQDTTKSTQASAGGSGCKSYAGPTVDTRWGPVQVKASAASGGKICSVSVLQNPSGGRSSRINSVAVPILNSEAMSAQSAKINAVSGATITSRAYKQSLQAILDAAHG
jgi:uncharacterized protein with FMN-binding domain